MTERVLVIGASGFIGQHLVRALAQKVGLVIAVSRKQVDFGLDNVEPVRADLQEPDDFKPLLARSDAVAYLAATSTPGTSAGNPLLEIVDNLRPLAALLQALQEHAGVRLLYLSSGGSLYPSSGEISATEKTPVQPRSYHGAGKIAAEHFFLFLRGAISTRVERRSFAHRTSMARASPSVMGSGLFPPQWAKFGAVRTCMCGAMARQFVTICISMTWCN